MEKKKERWWWWCGKGIRGDEEWRDNDRKRGRSKNIKERLQVGMERDKRVTERLRELIFFIVQS